MHLLNPYSARHGFLRRQAGRVRKLVHWTVTGQLVRQLRDRRGVIQARWDYLLETLQIMVGVKWNSRGPYAMRERMGLPLPLPAPTPAKLALETSDQPVLSIIIPTYGQVDHTLGCLATLAAWPPKLPFEVLVVDDASGDPRVAELRQVQGIRLTERTQNLGFLRSCNAAAAEARGRFLFLLNNDTEVMPGALDALAETFGQHPDAGLVGARLLYPNGWQQEAGGIIWRDGSGWNYGNRDDPRKPEYNYLRDADYISGAAIMIPTELWRDLGGFDEHYVPAYCEDSDLCFRVRAAGRRVLYQPRAAVIHHEGVSHGTDVTAGLKAYQVVNSRKLRERWAATLERDHAAPGERLPRSRDRALGRKFTLVLDNNVPEPDRDAGSRTMLAFMEGLLASGRVVKFWPLNRLATPGYTEALQARGIEVLYGPWPGALGDWMKSHGAELDEILLSRPHVAAETLGDLRAHSTAPILFYGHDLHHARVGREAEARQSPALAAEAARLLTEERAVWRAVDLVTYPSEEEAVAVRALEPGVAARALPPYALPPLTGPAPQPEGRAGVLFVAGFSHPPNEDAALWFVRDVLPLLRATDAGLGLTLAGSNPTELVRGLAGPGIEVTGFISDEELARRYAAARVVICPLRYGAGIKLKVVEALHQGVPLVTTPTGSQGLEGLEAVCAVTEDAAEFARHVALLLADDDAWRAQGERQRAFIGSRFSAEAVSRALDAAFAEASVRASAAAAPRA